MFLKGMIIGLFVGVMLGFLAAGLMVAAREAEGIGDDEGAMMAGGVTGGKVERPYDWPGPPLPPTNMWVIGDAWTPNAVSIHRDGSLDKEDSHG